jgi:hypothetical protein
MSSSVVIVTYRAFARLARVAKSTCGPMTHDGDGQEMAKQKADANSTARSDLF